MSCFCRTELNSGIKFDKSTAEAPASASNFLVKFGTQLISTSFAVLHDSGTAAIQTSYVCCAKQNWRNCLSCGNKIVTWLQKILNLVRLWHYFWIRLLNQIATVEPNCNQVRHKLSNLVSWQIGRLDQYFESIKMAAGSRLGTFKVVYIWALSHCYFECRRTLEVRYFLCEGNTSNLTLWNSW